MLKSDFPFFHPFRVRYAEIDAQGIVFNAHYLTYFDTAITEYTRAVGFDYMGHVKETGHDFHLVKAVVEYKAPIYFDDEVEVYVRAGQIGRSSLTWELAIFRRDEEQLLASGEIIWVYTHLESRKSTPLPEWLTAVIREKEGGP